MGWSPSLSSGSLQMVRSLSLSLPLASSHLEGNLLVLYLRCHSTTNSSEDILCGRKASCSMRCKLLLGPFKRQLFCITRFTHETVVTPHHYHNFGKEFYHKYFCTTCNHTILVPPRPTHFPHWTKTFLLLLDGNSQVLYSHKPCS